MKTRDQAYLAFGALAIVEVVWLGIGLLYILFPKVSYTSFGFAFAGIAMFAGPACIIVALLCWVVCLVETVRNRQEWPLVILFLASFGIPAGVSLNSSNQASTVNGLFTQNYLGILYVGLFIGFGIRWLQKRGRTDA